MQEDGTVQVNPEGETWISLEEFVREPEATSDGALTDERSDATGVGIGSSLQESSKKDSESASSVQEILFPYNKKYILLIEYYKQLLQLYFRSCLVSCEQNSNFNYKTQAHETAASTMSSKITSDEVFSCVSV